MNEPLELIVETPAVFDLVDGELLDITAETVIFDLVTVGDRGPMGVADAETIRDVIGAALVAGANITITVSDAGDTITIASTGGVDDEAVRDVIAAALVAGTNITITIDDPGDTITIAATGVDAEQVRDIVGATLVAGTNVTVDVDDAGDTITISAIAGLYPETIFQIVTPDPFFGVYPTDPDGVIAVLAAFDPTWSSVPDGSLWFFRNGNVMRRANVGAFTFDVVPQPAVGATVVVVQTLGTSFDTGIGGVLRVTAGPDIDPVAGRIFLQGEAVYTARGTLTGNLAAIPSLYRIPELTAAIDALDIQSASEVSTAISDALAAADFAGDIATLNGQVDVLEDYRGQQIIAVGTTPGTLDDPNITLQGGGTYDITTLSTLLDTVCFLNGALYRWNRSTLVWDNLQFQPPALMTVYPGGPPEQAGWALFYGFDEPGNPVAVRIDVRQLTDGYWSGTPGDSFEAIERLAAAVSGLLGGTIP